MPFDAQQPSRNWADPVVREKMIESRMAKSLLERFEENTSQNQIADAGFGMLLQTVSGTG